MFGIKSRKRIKELERKLSDLKIDNSSLRSANKTLLAQKEYLEHHLGLCIRLDELEDKISMLASKNSGKKK